MTEQTLPVPNPDTARVAPDWLSRGIIYQIWLRSFTPEGTLHAATQRLADIAELGATVVYLSPVMLADDDPRREYWSPRQRASIACNPRNPYRAKDYDAIDPEYGDEADLCRFIATAHRYGLRVVMDMVFLHTGPTSTLTAHPDFHQRHDDGSLKLNGWRFALLNFDSRELRQYLIRNMAHWVDRCDVDGFRCDVSGHVPQDFWEEARDHLQGLRADLGMIAESDYEPREQVKAFDVSYSFQWYNALLAVMCEGKPASLLREKWEYYRDYYPKGARFLRYCDNHDLHRADVVFGERGCQAAATLSFLLDGVPMLYNGQEIGDATPQDLFSHWPIRWEAANLPQARNKRQWYAQLCRMRRTHAVLSEGQTRWLDHNQPDTVAAFVRSHGKQTALCAINLTNRPMEVTLQLPGSVGPSRWQILRGQPQQMACATDTVQVKLNRFEAFVALAETNLDQ